MHVPGTADNAVLEVKSSRAESKWQRDDTMEMAAIVASNPDGDEGLFTPLSVSMTAAMVVDHDGCSPEVNAPA